MCETYNKSSIEEMERQCPQYKSQKYRIKEKRLRKHNYNHNDNYHYKYDYDRDSRFGDKDRLYSTELLQQR